MNKMRKTDSIILAIAFMCVSLFSVIYISHAINHNCSGEDCPICETVAICEQTLRTIGSSLISAIIEVLALPKVATVLETSLCCMAVVSLISQKVRMNN